MSGIPISAIGVTPEIVARATGLTTRDVSRRVQPWHALPGIGPVASVDAISQQLAGPAGPLEIRDSIAAALIEQRFVPASTMAQRLGCSETELLAQAHNLDIDVVASNPSAAGVALLPKAAREQLGAMVTAHAPAGTSDAVAGAARPVSHLRTNIWTGFTVLGVAGLVITRVGREGASAPVDTADATNSGQDARRAKRRDRKQDRTENGVPAPIYHEAGAPMPRVSKDHPEIEDVLNFLDWSAAQYAHSPKHQKQLANVLKNTAFRENAFRIHALNLNDNNATDPDKRTPSSGMFQYIRPTFDEFSTIAQQANREAWTELGDASYTDWRAQALTTAWALSVPSSNRSSPVEAEGEHWSRWTSIVNLMQEHEENPRNPGPKDPRYWQGKLRQEGFGRTLDASVDATSTYGDETRRYTHEQLAEIERTGYLKNLPWYPSE